MKKLLLQVVLISFSLSTISFCSNPIATTITSALSTAASSATNYAISKFRQALQPAHPQINDESAPPLSQRTEAFKNEEYDLIEDPHNVYNPLYKNSEDLKRKMKNVSNAIAEYNNYFQSNFTQKSINNEDSQKSIHDTICIAEPFESKGIKLHPDVAEICNEKQFEVLDISVENAKRNVSVAQIKRDRIIKNAHQEFDNIADTERQKMLIVATVTKYTNSAAQNKIEHDALDLSHYENTPSLIKFLIPNQKNFGLATPHILTNLVNANSSEAENLNHAQLIPEANSTDKFTGSKAKKK